MLDDPRYNQWLRKKSGEVALCSYCKSCYIFNIWYWFFYFYISRYCAALLKAVSFIDPNPLGACIAEKQESYEKLSKWKEADLNHVVATEISEEQCHRPQGIFQFSPLFFQRLTSNALMPNFDCLYLYPISRHAFHFLTCFVFKLFCFRNIRSDTHV